MPRKRREGEAGALARKLTSYAIVQSGSYHVEPLPDLDADFGPQLTDVGVVGVLKVT